MTYESRGMTFESHGAHKSHGMTFESHGAHRNHSMTFESRGMTSKVTVPTEIIA